MRESLFGGKGLSATDAEALHGRRAVRDLVFLRAEVDLFRAGRVDPFGVR